MDSSNELDVKWQNRMLIAVHTFACRLLRPSTVFLGSPWNIWEVRCSCRNMVCIPENKTTTLRGLASMSKAFSHLVLVTVAEIQRGMFQIGNGGLGRRGRSQISLEMAVSVRRGQLSSESRAGASQAWPELGRGGWADRRG